MKQNEPVLFCSFYVRTQNRAVISVPVPAEADPEFTDLLPGLRARSTGQRAFNDTDPAIGK